MCVLEKHRNQCELAIERERRPEVPGNRRASRLGVEGAMVPPLVDMAVALVVERLVAICHHCAMREVMPRSEKTDNGLHGIGDAGH